MVVPPRLQPGDTVGVVAPSGPFEPERLRPALDYLTGRGYRVREGRSLYERERYLAGSDAERASDLNGDVCRSAGAGDFCRAGRIRIGAGTGPAELRGHPSKPQTAGGVQRYHGAAAWNLRPYGAGDLFGGDALRGCGGGGDARGDRGDAVGGAGGGAVSAGGWASGSGAGSRRGAPDRRLPFHGGFRWWVRPICPILRGHCCS